MAIALVQSTKTDPAVGSTVTLTFGASPTAGNVMVAWINFSEFGTSRTCTPPTGWTSLIDETQSFVRHAVFYRVVQSGDGTAYVFTLNDGLQPVGGQMGEWSGAHATTPILASGTTKSASTASLVGPSQTPSVLSTQAVAAFTMDTNQIGSVTVGTGFTIIETSGGINGRGGSTATRNSLTSDTTTAISTTWTLGAGADSCIASQILIQPPATASAQVPYTAQPLVALGSWSPPPFSQRNVTQAKIAPLIPVPSPFVPGWRTGTIYPAILRAHQDAIPQIELVATGVIAPDASDQPPRQFALAPQTLTQIGARWVQAWDAQTAPKNAAWNIPPALVVLPYVPQPPAAVLLAWVPPFVAPPRPTAIAPLTLPTGAAPIPRGPLAMQTLTTIAQSWVASWTAQRAAPNAGWNVPPVLVVLPHVAPPQALWTAWIPPYVAPPRPVAVAPLTLAYGAPPPPRGPLAMQNLMDITATWAQTWVAQHGHVATEGVAVTFRPAWAVAGNSVVGFGMP